MYLFSEFLTLFCRIVYLIILFALALILLCLSMLFYWCKFLRKFIGELLDDISWYIDNKLRGE